MTKTETEKLLAHQNNFSNFILEIQVMLKYPSLCKSPPFVYSFIHELLYYWLVFINSPNKSA